MIDLMPDEEIMHVVRKHWFVPLLRSLNAAFMFLIPASLIMFVLSKKVAGGDLVTSALFGKPSFFVFGLALWGLILWLHYFSFWTDYQLDGWIITNKRVIDVDQKGFFKRSVSSFRLERMQDATIEIHGIIATLLNFGDIHIQTAGTDEEFVLEDAPKPEKVKAIIMKQYGDIIDNAPHMGADIDSVSSAK